MCKNQSWAEHYSEYRFKKKKSNIPATDCVDFIDFYIRNTLLKRLFLPQFSTQVRTFNTLPNTGKYLVPHYAHIMYKGFRKKKDFGTAVSMCWP